jgi:hypothetical protein
LGTSHSDPGCLSFHLLQGSTLGSPRCGLSFERSLGEKGQRRKSNDEQDTEGQHDSLSSRHSDLFVLFWVAPVSKVKRFRPKLDLSFFVIRSIDDVVNEVAVALFEFSVHGVHVLGHQFIVLHVNVALSTTFEKSSTHGDDVIKLVVRGLDVFTVDSLAFLHLLPAFLFVGVLALQKQDRAIWIESYVSLMNVCSKHGPETLQTYSAITRDAFVRKVEELFVVHAVTKDL